MTVPSFAVATTAAILDGLLIWRLLSRRMLRLYPYFSAYVLYDICCDLLLIAIDVSHPNWFGSAYWTAEVGSTFLRFVVIWEVVRTLFPPGTALWRVAQRIALGICALTVPAMLALGWAQSDLIHFSYRYIPPAFEQYVSLAQAVLLLAAAVVARYYKLPLGRNSRGLIFGFGLYLTIYAMDFGGLQFMRGFFPYWHILLPAAYISLTAFWIWAFWEYAPSPIQLSRPSYLAESKERWNVAWLTATRVIRREQN